MVFELIKREQTLSSTLSICKCTAGRSMKKENVRKSGYFQILKKHPQNRNFQMKILERRGLMNPMLSKSSMFILKERKTVKKKNEYCNLQKNE